MNTKLEDESMRNKIIAFLMIITVLTATGVVLSPLNVYAAEQSQEPAGQDHSLQSKILIKVDDLLHTIDSMLHRAISRADKTDPNACPHCGYVHSESLCLRDCIEKSFLLCLIITFIKWLVPRILDFIDEIRSDCNPMWWVEAIFAALEQKIADYADEVRRNRNWKKWRKEKEKQNR